MQSSGFGKQYSMFMEFIRSIKEGKRSIIYGEDYVVLSKNVYDSMVERLNPICDFPLANYDEDKLNDWVKERFIKGK